MDLWKILWIWDVCLCWRMMETILAFHHQPTQHFAPAPSNYRRTQHLSIAPQQLGSFEPLQKRGNKGERRTVAVQDLLGTAEQPHLIPFQKAWDLQRQLLQTQLNGLNDDTTGDRDTMNHDTILFVEHEPVYTLGTASDASLIHKKTTAAAATTTTDIPIVRMDRGGEVTYHGPGQLTIYPVLNLRHYRQDIHWYMRALERVAILALNDLGIQEARVEPNVTGVWVNSHKVAAVGIKGRRWITQHGLAINVTPESLPPFDGIVPCGLHGRSVGCVQQFISAAESTSDSATAVVTVRHVAKQVRAALEDVFDIRLVDSNGPAV